MARLMSAYNASKWVEGVDGFWKTPPRFTSHTVYHYDPLKGDKLYERQAGHLASALLVEDYDPQVEVDEYIITGELPCIFPNKGELVSGSFMSRSLIKAHFDNGNFSAEDIDIYFKHKDHAKEFVVLNSLGYVDFSSGVCAYVNFLHKNGYPIKINLIYGIEYSSPARRLFFQRERTCAWRTIAA